MTTDLFLGLLLISLTIAYIGLVSLMFVMLLSEINEYKINKKK